MGPASLLALALHLFRAALGLGLHHHRLGRHLWADRGLGLQGGDLIHHPSRLRPESAAGVGGAQLANGRPSGLRHRHAGVRDYRVDLRPRCNDRVCHAGHAIGVAHVVRTWPVHVRLHTLGHVLDRCWQRLLPRPLGGVEAVRGRPVHGIEHLEVGDAPQRCHADDRLREVLRHSLKSMGCEPLQRVGRALAAPQGRRVCPSIGGQARGGGGGRSGQRGQGIAREGDGQPGVLGGSRRAGDGGANAVAKLGAGATVEGQPLDRGVD
mmetsp:Transcript_64295/g.179823  ORF Transcript_64295/g.179823 Transcript_64295/m.179823 type:complete len:266 (+) Transcript_64295:430-1227(+)